MEAKDATRICTECGGKMRVSGFVRDEEGNIRTSFACVLCYHTEVEEPSYAEEPGNV